MTTNERCIMNPENKDFEYYYQLIHSLYTELYMLKQIRQDHIDNSPFEPDEIHANDGLIGMLNRREEEIDKKIRELSTEVYYLLLA